MTSDLNDRELDVLLVEARMVPPTADPTLADGRAVLDAAVATIHDELAIHRGAASVRSIPLTIFVTFALPVCRAVCPSAAVTPSSNESSLT